MIKIKTYNIEVKDEDGTIYPYTCDHWKWEAGGQLTIHKYKGVNKEGKQEMEVMAIFQNARAIPKIKEVEDES